jgi:hypothetical protein
MDVGHLSLEPGLGRARTIRCRVAYLGGCFSFVIVRTSEMPVRHFPGFQVVVDVSDLRTLADPGDDVFYRALPTRWHP